MKRLKGAYPHPTIPDRWVSIITVNGKSHHLGVFETANKAHIAWKMAKVELPEKRRGRGIGHNAKKVVHDGKTYSSMKQLAAAYRTSTSLVRYYMKLDKPFAGHYIDEAI